MHDTPPSSDACNHKVALLSFLAAASVIVIHINVLAAPGSVQWWIHQLTANGICRWAVPFFFAVSGYFLAGHLDEQGWYGRAVRRRTRTLLVPFFVWNLVYTAFATGLWLAEDHLAGPPWGVEVLVGWDRLRWLGIHPTKVPYDISLWFLRSLYLLVLTSPVYVFLVRRLGWFAPLAFLVLSCSPLPQPPGGIHYSFMLFFAAGIAARLRPLRCPPRCGWLLLALGLAGLVIDRYMRFGRGITDFDNAPVPIVTLLVAGIWAVAPNAKLPSVLRRATFQIYLLHIFVIAIALSVFPQLKSVWGVLLLLPVSLALCVLAAATLARFFPRLSYWLFGGR